jgi:hypothetical protein
VECARWHRPDLARIAQGGIAQHSYNWIFTSAPCPRAWWCRYERRTDVLAAYNTTSGRKVAFSYRRERFETIAWTIAGRTPIWAPPG